MGCTMGIVKYLVYIFNLLLACAGLTLLVIGIVYKLNLGDIDVISEKVDISTAPTIAIVLGAIVFVISFLGCCGSIRENSCMLTTYAVMVLVILALQIAVGVYAFVSVKDTEQLKDRINKSIDKSFEKYGKNPEPFDLLQKSLKCCGVRGPSDWPVHKIPKSCYSVEGGKSLYETGCSEKAYDEFKSNIEIIGYIALGLCSTEVIASIFALCLVSSIKNNRRRGTY